ncbi:MAG: Na+/H+ antiporter subunit G [Candidatus Competibacter sp.]|nr:Na+/H+ antiporter subunit G [Candidatus Competibacter sp.]
MDLLLSFLILAGALFTFIGSLGLARLPDFYTRLHAPTKATTLGVGSLLIASAVYFSARGEGVSLHEVLVTLFLFITAPVSAHLLSKAALHLKLRSLAPLPEREENPEAGGRVARSIPGQNQQRDPDQNACRQPASGAGAEGIAGGSTDGPRGL